jgi:hypothetical protein
MASQAIFGFIGVILGSLTTSVLTIYRERLITRRDLMIRDQQYERGRPRYVSERKHPRLAVGSL